jgi:hypothetical protein
MASAENNKDEGGDEQRKLGLAASLSTSLGSSHAVQVELPSKQRGAKYDIDR